MKNADSKKPRNTTDLVLFSLGATSRLGQRVADRMDMDLSPIDHRVFEHGEYKTRSSGPVGGRDVYVLHSVCTDELQSVHDKLIELLFFAGSLKDAGALRVTALIPYLGYSRKDRRTEPQDPVATRYMAYLIESVGIDRVVTVDFHTLSVFENAFRIPTLHVEASPLFARHFADLAKGRPVCVVSPDTGGIKRAEQFRQILMSLTGAEVESAFVVKHRKDKVLSEEKLVGDVRGKVVVMIDDMIVSGSTIEKAASLCSSAGASEIHVGATHGLMTSEANARLRSKIISSVTLTDTVFPYLLEQDIRDQKLTMLDVSPLLADSISNIRQMD